MAKDGETLVWTILNQKDHDLTQYKVLISLWFESK